MKLNLRILTEEEWEHSTRQRYAWSLELAWRDWRLYSCEERGGHWWWLALDPDDGITFGCLHCPADIDDLYPDGRELMTGEFEIVPGFTLSLDFGRIKVNGQDSDGYEFVWHGPVTAGVRVDKYSGYWEPAEYDVWVDLEAA